MIKVSNDFLKEEEYKKHFMLKALQLAKKAYKKNEVPIGAIIVKDNKIIAKAYNKRNKKKNAIFHAELVAISKACKKLGDWRLKTCEMFVTVVPCPMCAGAIVNSRIKKVYYGASNQNKDLFENIISNSDLNHKTEAEGSILKTECELLLKDFFFSKR